jgi:hypothetical protein|tara:strand:+ start:433 stop:759 length:327 start_codon:yes stop_codon:yes gene_type:complete
MLKEILKKCNELNVYEERAADNNYFELVFYTKEADQWNKLFDEILGPVAKPSGKKPTPADLELTKEYGGIFDNQTLFKKDFEEGTIIAMFWPWQDAVRTTLKVSLIKK